MMACPCEFQILGRLRQEFLLTAGVQAGLGNSIKPQPVSEKLKNTDVTTTTKQQQQQIPLLIMRPGESKPKTG